jgi:hypothetical protein
MVRTLETFNSTVKNDPQTTLDLRKGIQLRGQFQITSGDHTTDATASAHLHMFRIAAATSTLDCPAGLDRNGMFRADTETNVSE